jgi:hypothetical protein
MTTQGSGLKAIKGMVNNAGSASPNAQMQNDILNGIYPISVRSSVGPVKSMTFEQHTSGGEADVHTGASNRNITSVGLNGFYLTRYNTNTKMVGNNLFNVGGKCRILVSDIGDTSSREIAQGIGFGGMQYITELRGTINESGWEIEVKSAPDFDKHAQIKVEEFAKNRAKTGLFSGLNIHDETIKALQDKGYDFNQFDGYGGFDLNNTVHRDAALHFLGKDTAANVAKQKENKRARRKLGKNEGGGNGIGGT